MFLCFSIHVIPLNSTPNLPLNTLCVHICMYDYCIQSSHHLLCQSNMPNLCTVRLLPNTFQEIEKGNTIRKKTLKWFLSDIYVPFSVNWIFSLIFQLLITISNNSCYKINNIIIKVSQHFMIFRIWCSYYDVWHTDCFSSFHYIIVTFNFVFLLLKTFMNKVYWIIFLYTYLPTRIFFS